MRRDALARWVAGAALVALLIALGVVQFASDAFTAAAAAPDTVPTRVPLRFARSVYAALDRAAPAPYVEETLAADALARGDADAAERHALRLPASPVRDELFARIAQSRGQPVLALEYFLAAPDAAAVGRAIEARAARRAADGYALAALFEARLTMLPTHPDALAQAYWQMGLLANRTAWVQVPGSAAQRRWLARGQRCFDAAVRLSPLSEQYAIAAANQASLLGDRTRAAELFSHANEIDPASADAIAGLGVVAFDGGDRAAARRYLARARARDPQSLMVRALERDLR